MAEMLDRGAATTPRFAPDKSYKPALALALGVGEATGDQFELAHRPSEQQDWSSNAYLLSSHAEDGSAEILFACGALQGKSDAEALLLWADECRHAAPAEGQLATFSKFGRLGHRVRRLICVIMPQAAGTRLAMILIDGSEGPSLPNADGLEPRLLTAVTAYMGMRDKALEQSRQITGLVSALNSIDIGMCVIDSHGRAMFANHAADEILREGDGLRWDDGSIVASQIADTLKLHVAIRHVIGSRPAFNWWASGRHIPIIPLQRSAGRRPLMVALLPVEGEIASPNDPAAILCFYASDANLSEVLMPMCKLYGLSPVETRLAAQLASGATLAEAATAMRVKQQTARSYLKQIFLKTGTKRQSDLVRIMLSSVLHTWHDYKPELV